MLDDWPMPNGVIMWFDSRTGEARIRRDGHEYPAAARDIDTAARVPSARVHFDIRREGGVERAVNVTLRAGGRHNPRQHRFGDLAGAHHPDEKGHHPLTDNHPGTDPAHEGHPVRLIEEWGRLANLDQPATLRLLYAPEAVLHIEEELVVGRDALIDRLGVEFTGQSSEAGSARERDGIVVLSFRVGDRRLQMEFAVHHGRVVEQWVRPAGS